MGMDFIAYAPMLINFMLESTTTVSQDVQTRFTVQFAFVKFLSKKKEIFEGVLYP